MNYYVGRRFVAPGRRDERGRGREMHGREMFGRGFGRGGHPGWGEHPGYRRHHVEPLPEAWPHHHHRHHHEELPPPPPPPEEDSITPGIVTSGDVFAGVIPYSGGGLVAEYPNAPQQYAQQPYYGQYAQPYLEDPYAQPYAQPYYAPYGYPRHEHPWWARRHDGRWR